MWELVKHREKIALLDDKKQKLTYEELEDKSNQLAEKIGKRCLVFSLCSNQIGSVLGYVSFLNHGIVPVLLNAYIDTEFLNQLINKYQPEFLWVPRSLKAGFEKIEQVYEAYGYVLLKMDILVQYPLYENLGLLLTTSGSTGSPKFVRQSYANILSNAEAIVEYLQLEESERPITTLPMNYTYGLSIINSHLLVGATILLTDFTLMQKEFWNFMKAEGATSFGGVPYTYEMLDKLRFFYMDLPELRYMTQAGGKLSPELHKKFAEYAIAKNKKFIVMYGQCEATARMAYLPTEKSLEKYGSMGIAIPGGKFKLIDTEGNTVKNSDTVGELLYEGPNVTLGYAECGEDLIKGDERRGKLLTGDMAKCDDDGFYYIVGRKKRFLKVYGNRVNLDEIDTMLKVHFEQLQCASTGVDDHVYIFITSNEYMNEIPAFLSEKTKLNHTAFQVKVINEIPKNDAGKIQYKELEKYYL